MTHDFSLTEIVSALLFWSSQRIRAWLHSLSILSYLIEPAWVGDWPPRWWLKYRDYTTWHNHRGTRGIPDDWLVDECLKLVWDVLGLWVEEIGKWARDTAQSWTRVVTGWALHGWANFSGWIDSIGIRLGDGMVWWKQTAISALDALYNWLPPEIRTNLQSWGALLNYWIQKAKDWVVSTYHLYITWGTWAWAWVTATGATLKDWYDGARGLLDEFRANPTGFIWGRLGSAWQLWLWFANNAVNFYITLWSWYKQDLSDFLADPAGWIYARLEAYVERIW